MALGWDDERTMACAVCGGPIHKDDTATLLSDPARELEQVEEHYATKWGPCKFNPDLDIDACTATNVGGAFFVVKEDGRRATACSTDESVLGSDRYYIPVHGYCLHLADRMLHSHNGQTTSMRRLWKVLRMRCLASVANGRTEPLAKVDAPENYCLPYGVAGQAWEGGDDHWCATNAADIPNLTAGVLDQLTTSSPNVKRSRSDFRARFENLPQEMQDHILSFVFSERLFPPQCTRLIPQIAWMDLLLDGEVVPFLWDLDRRQLEQKVAEGRRKGIEWDFELLVRRLCQPGSMADGGVLAAMPGGLRNRQRIWKLVESMYVGDYLPEGPAGMTQSAAVPRYWNELGDLQHPLTWVRR